MKLRWSDLGSRRADRAHGEAVEVTGWPSSALGIARSNYFLLTVEPNCCPGCVPSNRAAVIEVFADSELDLRAGPLRLSGTLHVETADPTLWRYQLRGAKPEGGVTRRAVLAASPLFCLPVVALAQALDGTAVDIHSHAGNLTAMSYGRGSFGPVADPMRQGSVSVICLAIVADSPIIKTIDGRFRPGRDPAPLELANFSRRAFEALHALVREQNLPIIRTAADLRAARSTKPSVIVASEGADFLEGKLDRLDEAYNRWQLRHLQLTHYRVNELGDIQTEPSEKGGLTSFGADVIRRCNQLGIVVDIAHGTFELVKKAAAVTTKPLVLSHTALTQRPNPWTRFITPDHAKLVAGTRGVIGIWPVTQSYTVQSYADSIARMVDIVGVDHVGFGTDMLGLGGPSALPDYADLPKLAAAMAARFKPDEIAKILGGNYRRVFEASLL